MPVAKGSFVINDGTNKVVAVEPADNNLILHTDTSTNSGVSWTTLPRIFFAYAKTGNVEINTKWVDIAWDTEVRKDSHYTHQADSANITVNQTCDYKILLEVGTQARSDKNRSDSESEVRIMLNAGDDFVELDGTRANMYNCSAVQGKSSCQITRVVSLREKSIIKAQISRSAGNNTILTSANACRLLIESLM